MMAILVGAAAVAAVVIGLIVVTVLAWCEVCGWFAEDEEVRDGE